MTTTQGPAVGTMVGFDLTVPNAETVRDFYADVIGWQTEAFDMGGYADYFMKSPETGATAAGI